MANSLFRDNPSGRVASWKLRNDLTDASSLIASGFWEALLPQSVSAGGDEFTSFGAIVVSTTISTSLAALSETAFGTPTTQATISVSPNIFVETQFGSADILSLGQQVNPSGFDEGYYVDDDYGDPQFVTEQFGYITFHAVAAVQPTSLVDSFDYVVDDYGNYDYTSDGAFGDITYSQTAGKITYPSSINGFAVGLLTIHTATTTLVNGFNNNQFGSTLTKSVISPPTVSLNESAFGSLILHPKISLAIIGFSESAFSTAKFVNILLTISIVENQFATPTTSARTNKLINGFSESTFGELVTRGNGFTSANSLNYNIFGVPNILSIKTIGAVGFNDESFSEIIAKSIKTISVIGLNNSAFGNSIAGLSTYIEGFNNSNFGDISYSSHVTLEDGGFKESLFGMASANLDFIFGSNVYGLKSHTNKITNLRSSVTINEPYIIKISINKTSNLYTSVVKV